MPDQPLSFLIAGAGSIGVRHIKNLIALGINDITLYRTGKGALKDPILNDFPVIYNLDEALNFHPDVVVVSNPTALHMDTALSAAEQGCHLFLEKPISHNLRGVEQLARTVRQTGLFVQVGFQLRFHPSLQQIKGWLEEERIGRVISVHAHWGEYLPDWHPWEDYSAGYSARDDLGGGVLLTLSHPFDYLRWLIGEVRSVSCMAGQLSGLQLQSEDTACVNLGFENGVIGSVYLDYVQRPPQHTLLILGEKGAIQWDNSDGCSRMMTDNGRTEVFKPPENFERNTLFLDQMRTFLQDLSWKKSSKCSLHDGVRALDIVMAAKQSVTERREIDIRYTL